MDKVSDEIEKWGQEEHFQSVGKWTGAENEGRPAGSVQRQGDYWVHFGPDCQ